MVTYKSSLSSQFLSESVVFQDKKSIKQNRNEKKQCVVVALAGHKGKSADMYTERKNFVHIFFGTSWQKCESLKAKEGS